MRTLSYTIILVGITLLSYAQSPHGNDFKIDCAQCHNSSSWEVDLQAMKFDHDSTNFKLTGQHLLLGCRKCHMKLTFHDVGNTCNSCHADMHNLTLGLECERCHSTSDWKVADIEELHRRGRFELMGAHKNVDCSQCHWSATNLQFASLGIECIDCHAANFEQTTSPIHIAAGIPINCSQCHNLNSWSPSAFNHASTGFVLTGGHLNVQQCSDCHHGSLTQASAECITCHQAQYNNAPDHVAQSFPVNCTMCHTTNNWLETSFDHSQTKFPLTGEHVNVECSSCHSNGFSGTPTDCNSCHHENYTGALMPNHISADIPTTCADCHSPSGWSPSLFKHIITGFELTGAHLNVQQCSECHQGSLLSANSQCISCHQQQYDYAPDHRQFGYPVECTMCHTTNNWLETNFDHSLTRFPLTGQHISVDCSSCHTNGFTGTPSDCNSCHHDNFTGAQSPNHTAAGLPLTCNDCHTTNGWQPSVFNHATTGFELTGGHAHVEQCSSCHKGSVSTTSPECISCHQAQYNSAPDHAPQGYPTTCTMCHTTNNWLETNFDHSKTNFPLTGAHVNVDCSSCHKNGYAGTSTQCFSCHQNDYANTSNPNHAAANFPVNCESCHTTKAWQPASFDHDNQFFPIYRGEHKGEWNNCSDCHTNSSNYSVFSCLNCHEHNKTSMDNEHRNRSGYSYESSACYSCHPNGKAD